MGNKLAESPGSPRCQARGASRSHESCSANPLLCPRGQPRGACGCQAGVPGRSEQAGEGHRLQGALVKAFCPEPQAAWETQGPSPPAPSPYPWPHPPMGTLGLALLLSTRLACWVVPVPLHFTAAPGLRMGPSLHSSHITGPRQAPNSARKPQHYLTEELEN